MNNRGQTIVIVILCFILGLMLASQFKSVDNSGGGIISLQRAQELTSELNAAREERNALYEEIEILRQKITEYEESAAKTGQFADVLKKELERVRIIAGITELEGPGISVILNDSKMPNQVGEDPNLFLIHADDILKATNELFSAGAEAVSINDQRVISTTEIRCVGPAVSINNIKFAPPYTINAIGDPETLESSLKMRGGIIDTLSAWGIELTVKKHDEITIPGYKGSIKFEHAVPKKVVAK